MEFTPSLLFSALRRFLIDQLRPYEDYNHIHVSEVCQCLRKAWFNRKRGDAKTLKHLSDSKCVVLSYGLALHHVLAEYLSRDTKFRAEEPIEYKISDDLVLCGRADLIGDSSVVEFKTCRKVPERPYEHHLMQINAYLHMYGKSTGYLVYISAYGDVKVFDVCRSEELWRAVVLRAEKLRKYLISDELPPPERSKLCEYCEWKFHCAQE